MGFGTRRCSTKGSWYELTLSYQKTRKSDSNGSTNIRPERNEPMLHREEIDLGTPTTSYRDQMDTAKLVLLEVTARRADAVPGLMEYLQDSVHIDSGDVGRRQAHGWFYPGAWKHEGHDIDEIFLNADLRRGTKDRYTAEDWLVTLVHEAAHAWNHLCTVKGTSNRGRYHNRRFAEVAMALWSACRQAPRVRAYHPVPPAGCAGRLRRSDRSAGQVAGDGARARAVATDAQGKACRFGVDWNGDADHG